MAELGICPDCQKAIPTTYTRCYPCFLKHVGGTRFLNNRRPEKQRRYLDKQKHRPQNGPRPAP